MALIACNECDKEISDKATACPSCGAPQTATTETPKTSPKAKEKTSAIAWVATVLVVLGAIWFLQSREFKEESLPELPIDVSVRESMIGAGKVIQVRNNSNQTLMIILSLNNPTTKQEKSFRLDIPAGRLREIGHLEGWIVASGDDIEIRNEAYKTWKGKSP